MRRLTVSGVVLASALSAAPALASAPPGARLEGAFAMTGRVTAAVAVRGERRGQRLQRVWQFTPLCPHGACGTVSLVRARAHGTDTLTLHRRAPHYYSGKGTFLAPLDCAGRVYPQGEEVPFTITVRVTAGTVTSTGAIATAIFATYTNRSRINLTPCVGVLGHDAARYTGAQSAPTTVSGGGTSAGT